MFCEKCGNQIPDGMKFCSVCGNAAPVQSAPQQYAAPVQSAPQHFTAPTMPVQPAAPAVPNAAGRLHCPNCKSSNIEISTETTVNGGLTTHSGSVSATRMSSTHRNYWFCKDCGNKFRNIQNLEDEIKTVSKYPVIYGVITVIALALSIWMIALISEATFLVFFYGAFAFGSVIATIVCFIYIFVSINRLKKLRAELDYLKYHCFN